MPLEERTRVASLAMIDISYNITQAHFVDGGNDTVVEARSKYKEFYPGRAARRMTHLGMMVGICLNDLDTVPETPIIYASAFAESKSLETFIGSFPEASPLHFQCSIHPSAVEQALIPRKKAVNNFYPITSNHNLAGQALETSFLTQSNTVIIVGGEEHGTWLSEHKLASDQAFAFSLQIEKSTRGIGKIRFEETNEINKNETISLSEFALAIKNRTAIKVPSFAFNGWIHITWE